MTNHPITDSRVRLSFVRKHHEKERDEAMRGFKPTEKTVLKDVHFSCGHVSDYESYSRTAESKIRELSKLALCKDCKKIEVEKQLAREQKDIEYAKNELKTKGIEAFELLFQHYGASVEVRFFIDLPKIN